MPGRRGVRGFRPAGDLGVWEVEDSREWEAFGLEESISAVRLGSSIESPQIPVSPNGGASGEDMGLDDVWEGTSECRSATQSVSQEYDFKTHHPRANRHRLLNPLRLSVTSRW